jgi:hypothetical protein
LAGRRASGASERAPTEGSHLTASEYPIIKPSRARRVAITLKVWKTVLTAQLSASLGEQGDQRK